jgi:protein TonB
VVRAGDLVEFGPGVTAPEPLRLSAPAYPSMARRLKRHAVVKLRVLVDEEGRVAKAEIVEGEGSLLGFDEAALDAAMRSTFKPATKHGVPVKMWLDMPITFVPE